MTRFRRLYAAAFRQRPPALLREIHLRLVLALNSPSPTRRAGNRVSHGTGFCNNGLNQQMSINNRIALRYFGMDFVAILRILTKIYLHPFNIHASFSPFTSNCRFALPKIFSASGLASSEASARFRRSQAPENSDIWVKGSTGEINVMTRTWLHPPPAIMHRADVREINLFCQGHSHEQNRNSHRCSMCSLSRPQPVKGCATRGNHTNHTNSRAKHLATDLGAFRLRGEREDHYRWIV